MAHGYYKLTALVSAVFLFFCVSSLSAEVLFNGHAQSLLYNYEALSGTPGNDRTDNYRFYQYLRLKLQNKGEKNSLSFQTYLRVTDDLNIKYPNDPNWRFYNGYLSFNNSRTEISLGRQWLHLGPGSLTLDGLKVSIGSPGKSQLTGYAGSESPYSRGFNVNGLDRAASGGMYFSTTCLNPFRLGVGWYQKDRNGEVALREIGLNLRAKLPRAVELDGRLDVNLLDSGIQKGIFRVRYKGLERFQFLTEYKLYTPRLFYKSYFRRVLEAESNQQLRGGVVYFLTPGVTLGSSYSAVFTEEARSGFFSFSAGCPFGQLTYYRGDGFGDNENGVAVAASLPLLGDKFELFANLDYSQFRIFEEDDRDYLFSSIFGLNWRPCRNIVSGIEFQDVNNDTFSKDFRVLLKFAYNFNSTF